jgi:HemY protein
MRWILWITALFAIAVLLALFVGNNAATVTLFWPPYRVDVSLNLLVMVLFVVLWMLYLIARTHWALAKMPQAAMAWRKHHQEQLAVSSYLVALSHFYAGRYLRARNAALDALKHVDAQTDDRQPHAITLRSLAHLAVAESAHALQDMGLREQHVGWALEAAKRTPAQLELEHGIALRTVRWALDTRQSHQAQKVLDALPQAIGRRLLALRLRLKAASQSQDAAKLMDTARMLHKHKALSPVAWQSIFRTTTTAWVKQAHDADQLGRIEAQMTPAELQDTELQLALLQRLQALPDTQQQVLSKLELMWQQWGHSSQVWQSQHALRFVKLLTQALQSADESVQRDWLGKVDALYQQQPRDLHLQLLLALICQQCQLWGKAKQLLLQVTKTAIQGPAHHTAWQALAQLYERESQIEAALYAWRQAASSHPDMA